MEDLDLLKESPLFSKLDDEEVRAISKICIERSYRSGEALFDEGVAGDTFYLIKSGVVKITKRLPDGIEKTICHLGKHDFFGEMALLDGGTRLAKARMLDEASLIEIRWEDFEVLLASSTHLAFIRS